MEPPGERVSETDQAVRVDRFDSLHFLEDGILPWREGGCESGLGDDE